MAQNRLGDLYVAKVDGEQEGLFYLGAVRAAQQSLYHFKMLVLYGETKRASAQVVCHVDVEVLDGREDAGHGWVVAVFAGFNEFLVYIRLKSERETTLMSKTQD